MNPFSRLALIGLSLALGACSALQSDKVNYKSAGQAPTLDIPPDLTQLSSQNRYVVPGAPVTASTFQQGQASPKVVQTAVAALGDVHVQREGNQRWLVVNRPADKLWDPIKEFWIENGFLLTSEQAGLGIMETDWAENRAKIPQDVIRATLGKVFDSLFSTGERDKFRTRLERNATGGTDIFISHRGMVEVFDSKSQDHTVWQPRPADPELEAEFLRRLMVKLGATPEQSKAQMAAETIKSTSRVITLKGQPTLQIDDGFDRAWRRVGLSLDRTSFTVEDRDRNKGIYFVRYVAPQADKAEAGFFSKLFSGAKAKNDPQKFRIVVSAQGNPSTVTVQNSQGEPADAADAERIVKVLAADLQ